MRFTDVITALLVAQFVAAHGEVEGAPKIFGLPKELRAGKPFAGHQARHVGHQLQARQGGNAEGRCGTQGGGASCAAGFCCSPEGYCGNTKDHCQAPDCQINYGPGCDANKTPAGASTRDDARPQLGDIAYGGVGIRSCLKPGTVAVTYDDGPYIYTEQVMAKFEARGGRATFFVTGNNIGKGAIDENWRDVIQNMYNNGHQIASHTWSHQDLSVITQEQRFDQMVKNEMAIRNIIGKYPTYMRPPYSSCSAESGCEADLTTLGYVVTSFDLDTDDYNQLTKEKIQIAKDNFKEGIDLSHHLSISHDIHELTALNLTDYMLDYIYENGLTAVTVGECMNDPKANWYRDSTPAPPASPSSSAPVPTPTGPTSIDGMCGAVGNGQSCIGWVGIDGLLGECCSQYGYCGNTADHCQTSCQAGFGKCGVQPSASPSASKPASTAGPVPTPTGPTSNDGQCGATGNGQSCIGFIGNTGLSECCSSYGWCGNSADHCQTGCQAGFGKCGTQVVSSSASTSSMATSSSAATSSNAASSSVHAASSSASASHVSSAPSTTPTTSGETSRDGSCGGGKGYTCAGFKTLEGVVAECCSEYGYCGNSAAYCGEGCNALYGNCPGKSSSVAVSSKHGVTSSVAQASSSTAVSSKSGTTSSSAVSPPASPSSSHKHDSSSVPVSKASSTAPANSVAFYLASSFSTAVKPSSTPCTTSSSAQPTPTAKISKDGKCGGANGGQTCAGYKNPWGISMGCCCKQSGRCSVDPWACGIGCDKGYGKCWF